MHPIVTFERVGSFRGTDSRDTRDKRPMNKNDFRGTDFAGRASLEIYFLFAGRKLKCFQILNVQEISIILN